MRPSLSLDYRRGVGSLDAPGDFREERKVSKPPCSTVRDPLLASRALLGTYFANIAAALVRHGGRISKSSPKVLRVAWERLAAESYVDDWLRRLFVTARERLTRCPISG